MNPTVSVIIPTFNRSDLLPRSVESVFSQTFKNWELIIVNDGSTDGTKGWLEALITSHELKHKVKIHHIENRGVSGARNYAINKSQTPWLAFLDSDDEWLPDKLEKQLELSNDFDFIHGEEIWVRNGVRVNPKNKHKKSGGRIFDKCIPLCCVSPSTTLIRRSLLEEVGLFNESYPVCEDYELWLRVCEKYEVGFVSDPVIKKYGGHEDQLSRRFKAMDYWRVKALVPYLNSINITDEERELVHSTLAIKIDILLKGYRKYSNLENIGEIIEIQRLLR
ncbi:MAG: glycosyltransferase family 2 protein [Bdellovibrionaceae bacterium]|jgi:glycosyltransferase involved in cell wall biosynthesis|nr:glycosyltransferase family 2 protein [Pseudobdellovibrionaceae bacterium]